MRSLDEVISLMEGVDFNGWGADALDYLKEYREQRRIIAKLSILFTDMFEWVDFDSPKLDGHQIEEALIKSYNRW